MLPEKHLKEKKVLEKRLNRFRKLWLLSIFVASVLLIGPAIHEISHIFWLQMNNCFHSSKIEFSLLTGLHGQVKSLCAMDDTNLLIFYIIGYLSTLTLGSTSNVIGTWIHRNGKSYAPSFLSLGTGMLLSVILSVSVKGDVSEAVAVLGYPNLYAHAVSAVIIMGVFAVVVESFDIILAEFESQNGRNETETTP